MVASTFSRGKSAAGEISRHPPANLLQSAAEADHAIVFGFVADLSPIRMIAILLATAGVTPGGLKMPAGILEKSRRRATPAELPAALSAQAISSPESAGHEDRNSRTLLLACAREQSLADDL